MRPERLSLRPPKNQDHATHNQIKHSLSARYEQAHAYGAPEAAETDVLFTEQQLAARHQRSVKTLRNLRVQGGYVPFVKIGRHVRYRLSDVVAYEKAHLQLSTTVMGGADA